MIDAIERQIQHFIADLDDKQTTALYAKLPRGKRLRAKLIVQIAGNSLQVIKTAAIVELIHAASLLHDDVIDDAYTRRNKPSLNALYGNKTAIMLGDILYSKGFFELNNISPKVAKIVSNAVTQLSLGELADVELSKSFNPQKDLYLKMIYQKTASLMEASAGAAANIAGKDERVYMRYGRNLGIAFQMIDDILDITQDSQTLGKPALHDYKEGKTTLPYIYLYEALDENDKEKLISMHGRSLKDDEINWLQEQFARYDIVAKSYNEAKALVVEAIELMNNQGESSLSKIAMSMIDREF
jgi:octaprenyl-diphosphate synthase